MSDGLLDYHTRHLADYADNLHLLIHSRDYQTSGEPMRLEYRESIESSIEQLKGVLETDMKRRKEKLGEAA